MRELTPCGLCMRVIDTITLPDSSSSLKTLEWHFETKQVVESKQSCPLCDAIWELLLAPSLSASVDRFEDIAHDTCLPVTLKVSNVTNTKQWKALTWASLNVSLEVPKHGFTYLGEGTIGIYAEGSTKNNGHRHPQFWISGRTKPHLTEAEDRILCAKAWLEDCEAGCHLECEPSTMYLPTRLIEVRPDQVLRLVSTHGLGQAQGRVRYATLSYCWGSLYEHNLLKTKEATLESYHAAIPETSLPKTFRDAIRTARSLDIPYLWIDSLCIVQDDLEDWRREAARMKDVYAGSTITIAASDGLNSSWGCYPGSDDSLEPVMDIAQADRGYQRRVANAGSRIVTVDKYVRSFSFRRPDINTGWPINFMVRFRSLDPQEIRRRTHLSKRGWAFQEQLLSHRILHCLDSELHWQCRHEYKTQSGQPLFQDDGLDYHCDHSKTTPEGVKNWHKWVEDYSRREFTVLSDRIPAFAGISDYYWSITGQSVVLGMRRDSLAKDLSWVRAGPQRPQIGGTNVPSWSWMSCNAPVWFDFWTFDEGYEGLVQDHVSSSVWHVDWTGLAMTSPIRSTMFLVKGPVKEVMLRIAPEAKNFNPPYFLVGSGQESDFSEHPIPWDCAGRFDDETHPGDVEASYTCLLLRSRLHKTSRRVKETFLILAPIVEMVTLADDDVVECSGFRRVGIASIEGTERTFGNSKVKTLELF
ncbi:het domain protein [Colletotrichum musicola]|uniref:Het domain protein n=1 Tax=Colletotrichum musicola TaxID=2175873 RepID=A0A8H6U5G9_9PEZI|nr:het domain protein [Colletotrichum musicola]